MYVRNRETTLKNERYRQIQGRKEMFYLTTHSTHIIYIRLYGRKEMFYLTTHSTHFIHGCMASDRYKTISCIYLFLTPNSRSVFRAGVSLNIHSFIHDIKGEHRDVPLMVFP